MCETMFPWNDTTACNRELSEPLDLSLNFTLMTQINTDYELNIPHFPLFPEYPRLHLHL